MNNRFRNCFANTHVVLPVVHVESPSQAIRNTRIACEAQCDGVFLINHGISHAALMTAFLAVKEALPDFWIGINSLGEDPCNLFGNTEVSGIWTDNAQIDERLGEQEKAEKIDDVRAKQDWPGLYFGGVSFKYQREVDELAAAARIAMRHMDVVTTSGPGTGHAPTVEKLKTMKEAMGDFPLAIASGVTPNNVSDLLPHCDCVMVATGISKSFTELDLALTRNLVESVREFSIRECYKYTTK